MYTSSIPSLEHPGLRVVKGVEDVVEVDEDARREPWQHLKYEQVHIAADLGDMGRVDEQDVTRLEITDHVLRDVLQR